MVASNLISKKSTSHQLCHACQYIYITRVIIKIEMNKLSCSLCTQKLQSPKLCPHCSQIFCKECIGAYLA